MNLLIKEKQTQPSKKNLQLPKGNCGGRGKLRIWD